MSEIPGFALAHPVLRGGNERREWLAERKKHVTATDIYTIFGFGYEDRSVRDLVNDKRDPEIPEEGEIPDRLQAGLELEPCVASRYMKATGNLIEPCRGLQVDPDFPLRAASLDYVNASTRKPTELKSIFGAPGDDWGPTGSDHVPMRFILQGTWQGVCTKQTDIDLAAWFVGYQFRHYTIPVVSDLVNLLTAGAIEFWDLVKSGAECPENWRPSSMPKVEEITMEIERNKNLRLDAESDEWVEKYQKGLEMEKNGKAIKEEATVNIRKLIGNADCAFTPNGSKVIQFPAGGKWVDAYFLSPRIDCRIYPAKRKAV